MSASAVPFRTWRIALRAVITAQAVVAFAAAISAGVLLTTRSHVLHSATAYSLFIVAVLHVLIALLAWHPGGGTGGSALSAAAFFVGVSAQVALGLLHLTALHVPLGVLLFGASVLQLAWVWGRQGPGRRRSGRRSSRSPAAGA
ncbi:hypothetical protein L2X99_16720 [Microbacterium sp. KUDC0406]|uniref:hypothetical protein n=1 Tax=Microbacterium sp. KUDC0406 TaxID=2909588 RepID=UPI001F392998|nr:hypothetical protein [Microbacterium sp. KUDC0406]UJP09985.1 hypothetical protein L2X99_16720 [Microbacterium sp. KUDC0406]